MRFEDLLREHRVPVAPPGHHHARHGWVQFDCPYCGKGSGSFHMGYRIAYRYLNCWRCGHHPLIETLVIITGLPFRQVKELVGRVPKEREEKWEEPTQRGTLRIPLGVGPFSGPHLAYLRGRGFDPGEIANLWGVKGIGRAPKLSWRLWIPFHYKGEIISWTTRALSNQGTRYINAKPDQEALPTSRILYGEDFVRSNGIICHEGPTDVWATGPGAVCVNGLKWNNAHVLRLSRYPVRVVCFDSEPEAQRRARLLCDALEPFPGRTINVELSGKDAASSPAGEIQELRRLIT